MLFGNDIFICVYVCTLARVYFVYVYVCVFVHMYVCGSQRSNPGATHSSGAVHLFFPFSFFFLQVYVCICMRVSTCMCAHVHVCILKWGGLKLTCVLLCTLSRQYLLLNLELADSG